MKRLTSDVPGRSASHNSHTRAAILAAAGLIFARAGLAGARVDKIAAAARVNKALLYYYFGSKQALFEAVIEEHFGDFNRRALAALGAAGSARAALLRYVTLHIDFISERHRLAALFGQLTMTGGQFLPGLIRKYFAARGEALGKLIERGVRGGEFRRVDAFQSSMSIISLIVFYFSAGDILRMLGHRGAYSAVNLKRRKREVLDLVRHGLFIDPEFKMP